MEFPQVATVSISIAHKRGSTCLKSHKHRVINILQKILSFLSHTAGTETYKENIKEWFTTLTYISDWDLDGGLFSSSIYVFLCIYTLEKKKIHTFSTPFKQNERQYSTNGIPKTVTLEWSSKPLGAHVRSLTILSLVRRFGQKRLLND